MAQGLVASFDMEALESAIKKAEKNLTHLVNHTQESAKRINSALNEIGSGIDIRNVNDAANRLAELRNSLKIIQEQSRTETDETIVRQLENDATSCIDEINSLVEVINKVNNASIGKGFEELSLNRLRSLLNANRTKLELGGEDVTTVTEVKHVGYTTTKEETEFVEYTNEQIQEIVNNIAVLESMVRQRLTPTIGKLGQAQKQALADKKAEMQTDKELYDLWLQQEHSKQRERERLETENFERMQRSINQRLATPQGALDFASSAKTQTEMEQAMKFLDAARKNIDLTTKEGIAMNDALIVKYGELKTAIEEFEGKTKDQNTLVATESAKYARLLKELNKYKKSLKELRESVSYERGVAEAKDAETALLAEINVLEDRKKLYAKNKESIKQAAIQVAADTAREETEIIRKEEERRTEIAKQEEAKRAEIARKYAGMSPKEAERAISESGIAAIEREQKAIAHLIEAKYKLNSANENYVEEIKQYDEWIAKHKSNLDKLNAAYKEQQERKKKFAQTPQGALQSAKEAKSISELTQAYRNLDAARKNIDVSTKAGKKAYRELGNEMDNVQRQLDRYGTAVSGVNAKHNELLHTGQQLKRALTGIFSVSAIKNYINRLIEVRGEFELQQRSLQALLQNEDQADKLWDKTIQLAVRSPYRIKELVTYTKQLAAYRVESDKLYDTTKMLADISAGLGVDMQRLILAYGQVKAANYLRGTELRQFSEAGINVLGELSKYFTELEGRAVSVGDVFERVSKRMVSFADVEEVLQRATGEGGIFYNMQEIQAETLGAQMKNLTDSFEVMLNEIGEDSEDILKGWVKMVRNVVENWRDFVPVITDVTKVLVAFKTVNALASLSNSTLAKSLKIGAFNMTLFGNATGLATVATTALNKVFTATAWGAALAVLGLIVKGIYDIVYESNKAERAAKQLRKELDKLYDEDTSNLDKQISQFEDLVRRLGETAEGTKEYKDIISQINSQYGEYLGFLADENTAYEKIAGSIDKVVYSLTQKARANTLEKAYQKTSESYLNTINDERDEITEWFESGKVKVQGEGGKRLSFIPTKSELEAFFRFVEKKSKEADRDSYYWGDANTWANEFFGKNLVFATAMETSFAKLKNSYRGLDTALKNLEEDLDNVYTAGVYGTADYLNAMKEWEEMVKSKRAEDAYKKASEAQREELERGWESQRLTIKYNYTLQPETGETEEQRNKRIADKVAEEMKLWDKHSATIKKANEAIVKKYGGVGQESLLNLLFQEQETAGQKNVKQITEEYANGYKLAAEEYQRLMNLQKEGAIYANKNAVVPEIWKDYQDEIKRTEEQMKAFMFGLELYGATNLVDPKQKDLNDLKKRATLLEEMRKEYERQRKYLSPEDAASEVRLAYEEAWVAVGGNINDITRTMLSDSTALANYIKNTLLPLVDSLPKEQRESARQVLTNIMGGFTTHASDEVFKEANNNLKRQVENLFDNYELSVDLKQLNIPASFAKELFGLETMDLKSLREQLEKMSGLFVGTIMEEYYNQAKERLANMEDKDRKERLKKYLTYTRDAIGERAKIKLEELRKLQEIEETFEEGEAKKRAQRGVKKEAQDALNKYEWEQFKSSDVFANIFNDLEQASATSIQYAIDQIKKYKAEWADMPVTEAKEMIKRLNELEVALLSKGRPSDVIETLEKELELKMKSFKIDVKSRTAYAQLRQSLIDNNTTREEQNVTLEKQIAEFETMQQLLDEGKLSWENLTEAQRALLSQQGWDVSTFKFLDTANLREYIENTREIIKVNQELIGDNASALAMINALSKAYEAQNQKIQQWIGYVSEAYSSVRELVGVLGDVKETSEVWWDLGEQMVNLTSQAVEYYWQLQSQKLMMKELEEQAKLTAAAQNFANLTNVIGWVLLALQAIVAVIKAIVNYKQAKIDAKIESHYKAIEKLEKEYQKLEKSISEAYDTQDLIRYNQELQNNLELQKQAAAEAKAAAESGKDNEKNQQAAEDAQAKYDELLEESAEKAKELFSTMTAGVFDDTLSAAEGFVDAWLEAYKEVGDGMSGLTEHFEEEMMSVVKRQAALQIVGQYLNHWKSQLEGIAEDENFDMSAYIEEIKKSLPDLSADLEEYYKNMPFTSGNELSGIQKGIQGITADQADVLAAYWNSVRFYMASVDQKFDIPLSRMSVLTDDYNTNPMLQELRAISGNTSKILDALNSVIDTNGGRKAIRLK